jgi:hypothetical protein
LSKYKAPAWDLSRPITYEATPIEVGKYNNHSGDLKIKKIKVRTAMLIGWHRVDISFGIIR